MEMRLLSTKSLSKNHTGPLRKHYQNQNIFVEVKYTQILLKCQEVFLRSKVFFGSFQNFSENWSYTSTGLKAAGKRYNYYFITNRVGKDVFRFTKSFL